MGKKAKKKAKTPHRENNSEETSLKSAELVPIETVENVASVVKERKGCIHIEKGVNLVELATKDWSVGDVVCEDCRENAGDRRGSRGKSKAAKKLGQGGETNPDGKAIWVCLQCGHRACGGVGLPTTPQSHAVRHAREARHPMAVHYENPHLWWCFQCSTLIPVGKIEEKEDHKDVILDAVKIIQNQLTDISSLIGIGSESVNTGLGNDSITSDKDCYVVRGLSNLGNTCFFNSVMQNLLAMDKLRAYFSSIDGLYGPLTISLKLLFAETSLDTGKKGAVNPKSFFGCVCAKAPQFRGYQQQDSHELLRCLLDGLSMEELSVRKQNKVNHENDVRPKPNPTFVDLAFGGQVSSSVCCLECGHTSNVYEPFLDLSLPVPTRKPPKKTQHVSLAKTTQVPIPPKRPAMIRTNPNKDANGDPSTTEAESNWESSQEVSSVAENTASSSRSDGFDQPLLDRVPLLQCPFPSGVNYVANLCSDDSATLDIINSSIAPESDMIEPQQDQKENDMSWLDVLESEIFAGEQDIHIEDFDAFGDVDSGNTNGTIHNTSDVNLAASDINNERPLGPSGNTADDEVPLLVQDCQVILLPYTEESAPDLEVMEGQASAFTGQEEDASDFGVFGGLFDEPEPAIGPSPRPDGERSMKDSRTTNSFASESDPDEVDDESPVSIETCLTYFIKPELLSKEQGWHCEKCSKVVQRQKRRLQQSVVNNYQNNGSNDLEAGEHAATLESEKCLPSLKQEGLQSNGGSFGNGGQNGVDDDQDETRHVQDSDVSSHANGVSSIKDSSNMLSSPISFNSDSNCASDLSVASTSAEVLDMKSGDITDDELEENENTDSSPVIMIRDATKRLVIDKVPPILTIHLKRFSQDVRGRLSKLNGHVAFGETIDIGPYINPRCIDGDTYIYRLAGVVVHSGTMRVGHYEAYIRGGKKNTWYHTNDTYVRETNLEDVLRSEAYILFYIKTE